MEGLQEELVMLKDYFVRNFYAFLLIDSYDRPGIVEPLSALKLLEHCLPVFLTPPNDELRKYQRQ